MYFSMYFSVYSVYFVYLAARGGGVAPVSGLTPVAGVSLCVGGADALAALRVTVPPGVITGARWEENRSQPIRDETVDQSEGRATCRLPV